MKNKFFYFMMTSEMGKMEPEEIKEFYNNQLQTWPLALENAKALNAVKKKSFKAKDLTGWIQFNPARAVSTLAKVNSGDINKRQCFLCKDNRPAEQRSFELLPNWEMLVNPYPILPYHFTIANTRHIPQSFDNEIAIKLAEMLSGMVVFYNSEGAGASAPDHAHFQAVPCDEVPLIRHFDKKSDLKNKNIVFPFKITQSFNDILKKEIPFNSFVWKTTEGEIKTLYIPRRSHRPDCFYYTPPMRRVVSPGALDMAGIIVTPYKEDFDLITDEEILNIYSQVGFTYEVQ